MDTSDSEHFESADEDLHSDNENEKQSIKSVSEYKSVDTLKVEVGLKKLNLKEYLDDDHDEEKNKVLSQIIPNVDSGIVCDCEQSKITSCKKNNDNQNDDVNEENILPQNIEEEEVAKPDTVSTKTNISENIALWSEDRPNVLTLVDNLVEEFDKRNIRSESKEVLVDSSDENMWDNDDWEPVLDTDNGEIIKLHENTGSQDNDEDMWENDKWETVEVGREKCQPNTDKTSNQENQSWGSWGNGVSSILNTASQSVSTLTNQVSQGFSTVLETSMGIPDAEELAKLHKEEESLELKSESVEQKSGSVGPETSGQNFSTFGFGNLSNLVSGVSNLTKFVEHTGTKVITGGLDTLETIGKKTMEVLQEGDPGLKNKRAFLKLDKDKPVLSQVLREAKEKAEQENKVLQQKNIAKKLNYESLFDDYHGLVHLEALEMLSKQCDIKLQTLKDGCTGNELTDILETLDQIKELCELPDEDDEDQPSLGDIEERICSAVQEIDIKISYDKLFCTWKETEGWLNNLKLNFCDETEIHQEALQSLARLTALAVEQFHKAGELLLIKEHRSTADEADSLVQITVALTSVIGVVAGKFSDKLNEKAAGHENVANINELITNVFFEAANSTSYIQDAFQLLVPVLQVGAV
ncbi:LOW QUALITY PROTEIN: protein FAM114A2 [Leptinotarsa decemlineata]|uniref:LOW QUALITY PROTEIN: protein FAM114A2 n=1 Tax=Leptinotarsa decemlineata TaxID=7539 RepID=UPI003D3054BA